MIGLKFRGLFFDQAKVLRKADQATRKVLSRFGAFVRQTAKGSIRKRKKPSAPGSPPSSHSGLLKRLIFFGYEPARRSVVIGPAAFFNNVRRKSEAPRLLEHGGSAFIRYRGQRKRARYRERPFMGPAFEKEQSQLPALWRNSIQ